MTCFLPPQVNLPVATSIGVPTAMRRSTGENCLGRGEGRKSRAPNIFERGGAAKLVPARWRFSANQNRLGPSAKKTAPRSRWSYLEGQDSLRYRVADLFRRGASLSAAAMNRWRNGILRREE